jgi:hypothetical protein
LTKLTRIIIKENDPKLLLVFLQRCTFLSFSSVILKGAILNLSEFEYYLFTYEKINMILKNDGIFSFMKKNVEQKKKKQ